MTTSPLSFWDPQRIRLTYIGDHASAPAGTTTTYSGVSIGPAALDRYVVVAVSLGGAAFNSVASVSIGGSAATLVAAEAGGDNVATALAYRLVTAGTTANIVVTSGTSMDDASIGVYTINGALTSSPANSTSAGGGGSLTGTVNLTVQPNAVVVAAWADRPSSAPSTSITWTGLTRDYWITQHDGFIIEGSSASASYPAPGTLSITASGDGAGPGFFASLSAIAWN